MKCNSYNENPSTSHNHFFSLLTQIRCYAINQVSKLQAIYYYDFDTGRFKKSVISYNVLAIGVFF